jgi:anti-sigma regulatory factor (Ser/Thr protein kinase)
VDGAKPVVAGGGPSGVAPGGGGGNGTRHRQQKPASDEFSDPQDAHARFCSTCIGDLLGYEPTREISVEERPDLSRASRGRVAGRGPPGDDVGAVEHRATFELIPEAPSQARAVVTDELGRSVHPQVLEDATLLVSELITNAVRHAPRGGSPEVELRLKIDDDRIRVVVSDPGAGFVATPRLPTAAEGSGWGLYLVDRIADRWGIITKDRNEVWFELDAQR